MKMKVSDYIVHTIAAHGVGHVFGLSGGMITHLLDSIGKSTIVDFVAMPHEQAAGFAAEGYARMSGRPGVAIATSGPGATNLLTAIGSCYFDSTPAVFITGQVNRNEMKGDRKCRQLGFQELDIVSMAAPITKWATAILDPADAGKVIHQAFRVAMRERRGPVLLDIPMDVQRAEIDVDPPEPVAPRVVDTASVRHEDVDATIAMLLTARRPLVLVGGGIRASGYADVCIRALTALGIPVVCSLMGRDVLRYDHPLFVGMIGTYGNRYANKALAECDSLLVLGSRLDIRQTGADVESFRRRRIIHVDCDPSEVNNRIRGCRHVDAEVAGFCQALEERIGDTAVEERAPIAWRNRINMYRREWPATEEYHDAAFNPATYMRIVDTQHMHAEAYVVDVGAHQMWAAQSLRIRRGQRFITSGGMGAMGFAIPAAIGAAFAVRNQPIHVITGDGSFHVNAPSLDVIARHALPISIDVFDNAGHGMVRQFQREHFDGRTLGTDTRQADAVEVGGAYGVKAIEVVEVPASVDVRPKLAFGAKLDDMSPKRP